MALEAGDDLLRRHDADAAGRQLDPKREVVEPGADLKDGGFFSVIRNQLRTPFPGALEEQEIGMLGQKRLKPPHRLARDAERLAAGCQDAKARAGAEQRGAERRAGVEDVLTVVEQEQHVAVGEVPPQHISRRVPRRATNVEYTRRLRRDVFRVGDRGEIDKPDAIRPPARLTTTELDGRSGLAHPARAGQRHQPGSAQHVADGFEFRGAPDQPGERRWDGRTRLGRSAVFAPLLP